MLITYFEIYANNSRHFVSSFDFSLIIIYTVSDDLVIQSTCPRAFLISPPDKLHIFA